jgi:flagellar biosynthesis GTPase FlhF
MILRPRRHTLGVDPMATSPIRVDESATNVHGVEASTSADDANNKDSSNTEDQDAAWTNEPESDSSLDRVEEPEFNSTDQTTRQAAVQEANRLLLTATRLMMRLALHATQGQVPQATVALHCELLDILEALGAEVGRCV